MRNTVRDSTLVDNNKMSVDDPGGDDDSGAFGVLLNGDDNVITGNTITGSFATSHDYGYDGAAVEVYNGDRNQVTYNVTANNETFTELGTSEGSAADNVFAYNTVYSGAVTQFELGPNSVEADPRHVSQTDLHLRDGSPAIGRGEDVGFEHDLDGKSLPATPDAGAYQR